MLKTIFHGHSFVKIVYNNENYLIDPFITGNNKCDTDINSIIENGVKYIFLTHGHSDHLGDTVEIAYNTGCTVVCTVELATYLKNVKGLTNLHLMHIGGEYDFGDFSLKLVTATHGGGMDDMGSGYYCTPAGMLFKAEGKTLYHAGDTGLTYDMKLLGEFEDIYLAMLPIGGNFTMDIYDALKAIRFIQPKYVFPVHYNTWDIISTDDLYFSSLVLHENISIPKVLNPGQHLICS